MNNDEIIDTLELTGKLMDLHGDNPFKSKAFANAAFRLSKMRYDFTGKSQADIASIEGVGSSMAAKIVELKDKGALPEFSKLLEKTPAGLIEMLGVKGLGPKKVRQLWQELQIENIGELLYACNENRLLSLKGFGEKTQLQVKHSIEFNLSNVNKYHYASLEPAVNELLLKIKEKHDNLQVAVSGEMARKCEVIEKVNILIGGRVEAELSAIDVPASLPVEYSFCESDEFVYKRVESSSTPSHLEKAGFHLLKRSNFLSEEELYKELGLQYIAPELREGLDEVDLARQNKLPELIEFGDLKGVLHNHSTYSDGVHSLKEMAEHCRSLGYGYLGICDHSKSAFYANGLSAERVAEQQKEIEQLNSGFKDFTILKGIESDILNDGSLDYPEEVLKTFDFVVASVHSNLKMQEEKATSRLIAAIENPYTSILGHPTGRLLLARSGYPIDHKKIIDACAANKVHMELNAHPYRLDIDWRWIPYCLEKGVMVSINPDAHHKEAFHDMYYGTCIARKGRLDRQHCLNALPLGELLKKLKK